MSNRDILLAEAMQLIEKHKVTAYEIEQNTSLTAVGVQKIINRETKRPLSTTLETIISYIKLKYENKQVNEVIPVPEDDYMIVEFEDLETAAGRLGGGGEVAELPEKKKRLVPREYAKGFYLVVRVYGHSMDDNSKRSISEGEELLIKEYFDGLENLPIRTKIFVIVTKEGSVVKQIREIDRENQKIILHSFNPTWEDYPVHFHEITQLFTVEKKVKSKIYF